MTGRIKVRDLRKFLRQNNCTPERVTGSHEIWKLPNAVTISLVVNHLNAEVSRIVLQNIRRSLASAGITLE